MHGVGIPVVDLRHASHEACELKFRVERVHQRQNRHASHEACELKYRKRARAKCRHTGHASHEACELKLLALTFTSNQSESRLA